MPIAPDHRFLEVEESVAKGLTRFDDPLCAELAEILRGNNAQSDVVYAYELYVEETHRQAMDAFTLAQSPLDVFTAVFEIPIPIVQVYQHLFMDMSVFRDRLDRLAYAANYQKLYACEDHVAERMRSAVTAGPDYLRWQYASPNPQMDPRKIVRESMMDSFYRSMAHKGNALVSGVTKEAVKWMQNSVKYARALEELEPQTAKAGADQLKIALLAPDVSYSAPTQNINSADILH